MSLEVFHIYQWLLGSVLAFSFIISHQSGLLPLLLTDLHPDIVMYLWNNLSLASQWNQWQTWAISESSLWDSSEKMHIHTSSGRRSHTEKSLLPLLLQK